MKKQLIPETTMKWRQVYRIQPKKRLDRKLRNKKNIPWRWRSPGQ